MIWLRTLVLWWIPTFALTLLWAVAAHLLGVDAYSRGYVAGTVSTIGILFALGRAERADKPNHPGHL